MKIIYYALLMVLCFAALGCTQTSDVSTTFTWVATGDDGSTGTVAQNIFWYSTDSISAVNMDSNAVRIVVNQPPLIAGSAEQYILILPNLLSETRYYFSLQSCDERGNCNAGSNIMAVITKDIMFPGMVTTLKVSF